MLRYDEETQVMSIIAKDTGDFVFSLDNYLLEEGDKVYFTVNTDTEKPDPKIQVMIDEFTDGKAFVHLSSDDTNIPVGTYWYDIEINSIDGRVDTVVGPSKFKVLGGVKY